MRNLGELILDASGRYGNDVAFQVRRGFRLERVTFHQTGQRARRLAAWFRTRGLLPGDRVVVWAPNMPEYAVLYFGAWMAGIVVVPIDVRTKQEVLDRFVRASAPRLGFKSRFLEGVFGPPVDETFSLEDLFDLVDEIPPLENLPEIVPDDLGEIAYTSGTTGAPKGVMLTHGNFLAEVAALQIAFPLKRSYRTLSLLPLSHALELTITLLLGYTSGVRVTFMSRVNAATIGRALREDQITCLMLVPQLLRTILAGIERRVQQEGKRRQWEFAHRVASRLPFPARRLLFHTVHRALGGHLVFFGSGGAPLDQKIAAAWERIGIRIFEGYGLTETTAASAINTWEAKRLGAVGKPVPGVEVKIAEQGEILIRGSTVTSGYYQNPELTAHAFTDGWFHTGDVGSLDADGFLRITGREAFKIVLPDGRNVYPEDVEQTLNEHPLVRESCVVGIERDGGAQVHAAILTSAPEHAARIIREANQRLGPHQQIRGHTVWQEEEFPRTPILKIDRKLVRQAIELDQATAAEVRPAESGPAPDPLVGLVARVAQRPAGDVRDAAELEADLGLDSLGRVELVGAIEEEIGRVVDELRLTPQTTVSELRSLIAAAPATGAAAAPPRWPRSWWARAIGRGLLWAAFRIQDRWVDVQIVHPERAGQIPTPSILIFNYQGPYAPLLMLRALPARLRDRVTIAVDARIWQGKDRWQGWLAALATQAFPFVKSGGAVRQSLEEMGQWLDDGYIVIMSPEGEPERYGQLLPFLGGTGLMAVEMRVPVVPFKIEDYHRLFPPDPPFPYLPNRRGRARLIIGEPVSFPRDLSYDEASARARRALVETQ